MSTREVHCFQRRHFCVTFAAACMLILDSQRSYAQPAVNVIQPRALRIVCSNPSYGFLERVATEYQESGNSVTFEIQQIHNDWMMRQLGKGYAELAVHSGPLDMFDLKTLRKAFPARGEFEQRPVAQFAVAVVVHPSMGVRSLTASQIGNICTSKITNWGELGAARREIILVGQTLRFNSANILRRTTFPNQPLAAKLVEKTTKAGVIEMVKKTPGAVGFFLHDWQEIEGLRPLPIAASNENGEQAGDPEELSVAAVLERRYPLTDALIVVFHPNAPREAYDFVDFLKTEAAAKIALEHRLLTEHHRESLLQEQRLADVNAGKGDEVAIVGVAGRETLAQAVGHRYSEAREVIRVTYRKKATPANAVEEFLVGGSELLVLDGRAAQFERELTAEKVTLGSSALGVLVHPAHGVKALPIDELRQICRGEVKNWPAASGEGPPIRGYSLHGSQPVMQIYRGLLTDPTRKTPARNPLRLVSRIDNQQVVLAVARDPAGIGFVDLSQLPALALETTAP